MSKSSTLERVITDISRKDLGTARDRLLGLLRQYPNDLGLRHILGRIYLELQYPQEAGRYLYLVDDQSEIVQDAIRKYSKSEKRPAEDILKGLKLQGHFDSIDDEYARNRLAPLFEECSLKGIRLPEPRGTAKESGPATAIFAIGCALFLIASVIWGAIELVRWIVHLVGKLF